MNVMLLPAYMNTILVVDDDPDCLRFLTDALELANMSALVATSGGAALHLLNRIVPDLILMDAIMPDLDGFETTQKIKSNPDMCGVPVIFMTGLTEAEHVVEAFEVGGIDYVRKPIELSELMARVRAHLNQSRALQASVAGLDATERPILATDADGRLLWCTSRAEEAIVRIAPNWRRANSQLPVEVQTQIARLLTPGKSAGASVRIRQMSEGDELEMTVIARYRHNEVLIRLSEIRADGGLIRLQERLALSRREAEVLLWVSYGKTNRDISEVLDISPRTVTKHLERIFDKIGVETRSAAAVVATRLIAH